MLELLKPFHEFGAIAQNTRRQRAHLAPDGQLRALLRQTHVEQVLNKVNLLRFA
jgi:hypothetical protein